MAEIQITLNKFLVTFYIIDLLSTCSLKYMHTSLHQPMNSCLMYIHCTILCMLHSRKPTLQHWDASSDQACSPAHCERTCAAGSSSGGHTALCGCLATWRNIAACTYVPPCSTLYILFANCQLAHNYYAVVML